MKRVWAWWQALERSEKNYWLGLLMLFMGLTWSESIFVALTCTGAVIAIESVLTSYWVGWLASRNGRKS